MKVRAQKQDVAVLAISAAVIAVVAVASPLILHASISRSAVAYGDELNARSNEACSAYADALAQKSYMADNGGEDTVLKPGDAGDVTGQAAVVPVQGDASAIAIADSVSSAGLDPANVVQDADGTYVYVIQPGDTLTDISRAFGYSVDDIANKNGIRDVNLIYANSSLRIPNE